MSKPLDTSIYITRHFRWDEFMCNDGTPVPAKLRQNLIDLATELEIIRKLLGNRPITVLSGYRTAAWNRKVGGAPKSYHLRAMAADIVHATLSPAEVYEQLDAAMKKSAVHNGGLGKYKTFTHFDIRQKAARWEG